MVLLSRPCYSRLMNPLIKQFGTELLDDMVDVGLLKWGALFLVSLLMTRALWGSGGMLRFAAIVFTANLGFALITTAYWKYKRMRGPVYDG